MSYYLGRDVLVWLTTEDDNTGIKVDETGTNPEASATNGLQDGTFFADERAGGSLADSLALADLTGVDISIGVSDEDISYIGQRSVLKAEIKKETTVSLTRKKSSNEWDVIFSGPTKSGQSSSSPTNLTHGARWGCHTSKVSDGASAPKAHLDGAVQTFGYRVYIQLQAGTETIAVPMCQIIGHTVSINGDGTTEETMEFSTNVTPIIAPNAAHATAYAAIAEADM